MKKKIVIIVLCITVVLCACVFVLINGNKEQSIDKTVSENNVSQSEEQSLIGDEKNNDSTLDLEIDADNGKEKGKNDQPTGNDQNVSTESTGSTIPINPSETTDGEIVLPEVDL